MGYAIMAGNTALITTVSISRYLDPGIIRQGTRDLHLLDPRFPGSPNMGFFRVVCLIYVGVKKFLLPKYPVLFLGTYRADPNQDY